MQAGDLGFLTTTTVDFERKNTELFGRNELIIPFLFGPLKGRIPVELRMHRVSLLHSLIRYLHCHIQHVPRGLAPLAHADCLHPARRLCVVVVVGCLKSLDTSEKVTTTMSYLYFHRLTFWILEVCVLDLLIR